MSTRILEFYAAFPRAGPRDPRSHRSIGFTCMDEGKSAQLEVGHHIDICWSSTARRRLGRPPDLRAAGAWTAGV